MCSPLSELEMVIIHGFYWPSGVKWDNTPHEIILNAQELVSTQEVSGIILILIFRVKNDPCSFQNEKAQCFLSKHYSVFMQRLSENFSYRGKSFSFLVLLQPLLLSIDSLCRILKILVWAFKLFTVCRYRTEGRDLTHNRIDPIIYPMTENLWSAFRSGKF